MQAIRLNMHEEEWSRLVLLTQTTSWSVVTTCCLWQTRSLKNPRRTRSTVSPSFQPYSLILPFGEGKASSPKSGVIREQQHASLRDEACIANWRELIENSIHIDISWKDLEGSVKCVWSTLPYSWCDAESVQVSARLYITSRYIYQCFVNMSMMIWFQYMSWYSDGEELCRLANL